MTLSDFTTWLEHDWPVLSGQAQRCARMLALDPSVGEDALQTVLSKVSQRKLYGRIRFPRTYVGTGVRKLLGRWRQEQIRHGLARWLPEDHPPHARLEPPAAPPVVRQMLHDHFVEGYTLEEIGRDYGMSESRVQRMLRKWSSNAKLSHTVS